MAEGSTYKKCSCRGGDGKRLGAKCPKLRRANGAWSASHGTWYYQLELPPKPDGTRRPPLRRGGFASSTDAQGQLDTARELLAIAAPGDSGTAGRVADAITGYLARERRLPDPDWVRKAVRGGHDPSVTPPTMGEWLPGWLAAKKGLGPGTVRSYAGHIRLYLVPHIGNIRIDWLRVPDIAAVFDAIEERNELIREARKSDNPRLRAAVKGQRLVGPATMQRIRATLRSAINSYMKQNPGILLANPAALIELPPGNRPKPLVWTSGRVRAWQEEFDKRLAAARAAGGRFDPIDIWIATPRPSPVMVWTAEQTQVFLAAAADHRLFALWRLYATRGLRRGEGCGLRESDTDLIAAATTIRWQITQIGWETAQGKPKSEAGERQVALDSDNVAGMRAHRRRKAKERKAAGDAWVETEFEFTDELGNPLHPADVTAMFHMICYLAGLPPIRLHDLRHGAATLLLAAGYEMKVVQETLGLSSITIAADTYTSVLPQLAHRSAEAVADLIRPAGPAKRRRKQAGKTATRPGGTRKPRGKRAA